MLLLLKIALRQSYYSILYSSGLITMKFCFFQICISVVGEVYFFFLFMNVEVLYQWL